MNKTPHTGECQKDSRMVGVSAADRTRRMFIASKDLYTSLEFKNEIF